jgi:hypothetical protein
MTSINTVSAKVSSGGFVEAARRVSVPNSLADPKVVDGVLRGLLSGVLDRIEQAAEGKTTRSAAAVGDVEAINATARILTGGAPDFIVQAFNQPATLAAFVRRSQPRIVEADDMDAIRAALYDLVTHAYDAVELIGGGNTQHARDRMEEGLSFYGRVFSGTMIPPPD